MRMKCVVWTMALAWAASVWAAGPRDLPQQMAFAEAGAAVKVRGTVSSHPLVVDENGRSRTFLKGVLTYGNKTISIRNTERDWDPQCLTIAIDGRPKASIQLVPGWGHDLSAGTVEPLADGRGFEMRMPFVRAEQDGREVKETLTYRLRTKGPCVAEVEWSTTAPNGPLVYAECSDRSEAGREPKSPNYRGKRVLFGTRAWNQRTREQILARAKAPPPAYSRTVDFEDGFQGDFTIDADNEDQAVTFRLANLEGTYRANETLEVCENGYSDHWSVGMMRGLPRTGKIEIDLHLARERILKHRPPLVGGIDFWKDNGFHYAKTPGKNLFRNGSFERGFDYWGLGRGGANAQNDPDHFQIVEDGLFGGRCLRISSNYNWCWGLRTFPMALDKGLTYTLSCYVKYLAENVPAERRATAQTEVTLAIGNPSKGGNIKVNGPWGDSHNPESRFKVSAGDGWTRVQRTFAGDEFGLMVFIGGDGCLFDGFQLEEGAKATAFEAPPLEGALVTDDPDNCLEFGKESVFRWRIAAKDGVRGDVRIAITDFYGETVFRKTLKGVGAGLYELLPRTAWPYRGVFRIKAEYAESDGGHAFRPYVQYGRLNVWESLSNRHPTKDVFGCFGYGDLVSRSDDIQRRLMEWGFGATTWVQPSRWRDEKNQLHILYPKYRFQNWLSSSVAPYTEKLFPEEKDWWQRMLKFREIKVFTPEQLKMIEDEAYRVLSTVSPRDFPVVAFSNEEESSPLVNGATDGGAAYGAVQYAFYKGAKRANPAYKVAPTHGTSGWCKLRGRQAFDQYLRAANRNGFKYDVVAVHPYGNVDGGTLGREDADAETQYMRDLLAKHGYDPVKTPILMSECWNLAVDRVSQWGCVGDQDGWGWGKTGYDLGNHEYQHACQLARMYLSYLKYWPQVKAVHCWMFPIIDAHYRPMACALAVNTLGRLLGDPEYVGEARPVGGVRAYVFRCRDRGGKAVAAVWSIDQEAEQGLRKCPVLRMKFTQPVRLFDLMGNERKVPKGDGVQLTSAPLFVAADDAAGLVKDFQAAYSLDAATSLKVAFVPDASGQVFARIQNLTDRAQSGVLAVGGRKFPYTAASKGEAKVAVDRLNATPGRMNRTRYVWSVTPKGGRTMTGGYGLATFFAPKCGEVPDWTKVPALPFDSWDGRRTQGEGDASATYQVCWNAQALFVRVVARDSKYLEMASNRAKPDFPRTLRKADGALELYLDCGANGRLNGKNRYDDDDYRYDFAPPDGARTGRGYVWRSVEVDHQLADGVNMPTKAECAQKIGCDWKKTADGYEYVLRLDQRYIEPILLKRGFVAGLALYLHDYDAETGEHKGISTAAEEGVHPQMRPMLWPLVVLQDGPDGRMPTQTFQPAGD